MSSLRVILTGLIIPLVVTTVLANGFGMLNSNHLLLGRDAKEIDLSRVRKKWIKQPLDHFNASENRTFQMKYYEIQDYWKPNGPIYLFFNGLAAASSFWIAFERSLVTQMANETNGALFTPELRYYGASLPDIPKSNLTEYYKFLSFEQQLADIAYFIKFLKSDPNYKSSKVVVVGGSIGASIGVWLREFYPDLVDAAVASSELVLAKKDFKEFYEGVTYTLNKYGGEMCIVYATANYKIIELLLQTSDGIEQLKILYNICPESDLTVLENQQYLFELFYSELAFAIQHANPDAVKDICSRLTPEDNFTEYFNFIKHARSVHLNEDCIQVDFNKQISHSPIEYQLCSEFGFLLTTTSEVKPFVHWNPVEYGLKTCKGVIKEDIEKKIDEGVTRTNNLYGGRSPMVTKVVFSHGDMDAFQALQVPQDLGPDAPVIMTNGTWFCAVLLIHDKEPKQLTEHRNHVKELIKKWISTP